MLKLTSSFSKKVPVAGADYSSQSYHAAVEVELPDGLTPEQLRQRIHETFELVRGSVEAELNGKPANSAAPVQTAPPPQPEQAECSPERQVPQHPAIPPVQPQPPTRDKASYKQISFLTELALRKGVSSSELLAEVQKLHGVTALEALTRQQASKLIERLGAANRERRAVA
jgi:hypothetical protein